MKIKLKRFAVAGVMLVTLLFNEGVVSFATEKKDLSNEIFQEVLEDCSKKDSELNSEDLSKVNSNNNPEGNTEVELDDGNTSVVLVVGFEELETVTTHYKLAYDSLVKKFPQYIKAKTDNGDEIFIHVTEWKPVTDYNEWLGKYTFEPVIGSEYELGNEVVVPLITVIVEDEKPRHLISIKDKERPVEKHEKISNSLLHGVGSCIGESILKLFNNNAESSTTDLPTSYNGFEQDYMPEVRDQGEKGTCWAFAGMTAIETDAIKHNENIDNSFDLSELQLAYFSTHDYDDPKDCHDHDEYISNPESDYLMDGGQDFYVYDTILNGVGPVPESLVPYYKHAEPVDEKYATDNRCVGIKEVTKIPVNESDSIKEAIMEHGSVFVIIDARDDFYNSMYNSHYCNADYVELNHAVTLVGWDDDFPAENFHEAAPGNGAWLVRNSWGLDDYGFFGYFWISYYDNAISSNMNVTSYTTSMDVYDNTYVYGSSLNAQNIWLNSEKAECITDFKVEAGETIEAISVENPNKNSKISVEVIAGEQKAFAYYENKFEGTFTLKLDNQITIDKKMPVKVIVTTEVTTDDGIMVALEWNNSLESDSFSIAYSNDVGCLINGREYDGDAKVRLYTNNIDKEPDAKILEVKEDTFKGHRDTTFQIDITENSVVSNAREVYWTSNDEEIARVSKDGLVTVGYKKGTTAIIGTYEDCEVIVYVTVEPYKITYVLDEDTEAVSLREYYYPGNKKDCILPGSSHVKKFGYWLTGWCSRDTQEMIDEESLVERDEDLILSPVMELKRTEIVFLEPKKNLDGYLDNKWTIASGITIADAPYKLPKNKKCKKNPEDFIKNSKKKMEFAYWSFDPEGNERVSELSKGNICKCQLNKYNGQFEYEDEVVLYPQYRVKQKPDKPKTKKEEIDIVIDWQCVETIICKAIEFIKTIPFNEIIKRFFCFNK